MTLVEARQALVALLVAWNNNYTDVLGATDPPYVSVFGNGIDISSRVPAGQAEASFRIVCVAAFWDQKVMIETLAAQVQNVLIEIRDAPDWRLGEVRPDHIIQTAGGPVLAADVIVSTLITI